MKITIESTDRVIPDLGRIWNGVTEAGFPCQVIVIGITSESDEQQAKLEPELATLRGRGTHEIAHLKIIKREGN